MQVKTLILGAGLTGLSTAYHLEQAGEKNYLLVESSTVPGGLCASTYQDGFTYDYGGHLLHLHTPEGKKLVKKLLKNNLARCTRKAFVDFSGVRVPYPVQANLWALPPKLRQACADGLLARPKFKKISTFKEWCLANFGQGLYDAFFQPYNTKLWGKMPHQMTAEWCDAFVPVPSAAEIKKSLRSPARKTYGYNSHFYYPKHGGIGALAGALADKISHLSLSAPVTQIDLTRKIAVVNGEAVHFTHLVNTLPLPQFVRLLKGEKTLKARAQKLTSAPVTVFHLAVERKVRPFSWIYFPHRDTPFYRVGLQSGFSDGNAPQNTSLFYIELAGLHKPSAKLEKKILSGLVQKCIIKQSDRPLLRAWQQIPHAYAVFDKNRTRVVDFLLRTLARKGCYSAGRYGRWEYSFMECDLLTGRNLAKKIL